MSEPKLAPGFVWNTWCRANYLGKQLPLIYIKMTDKLYMKLLVSQFYPELRYAQVYFAGGDATRVPFNRL